MFKVNRKPYYIIALISAICGIIVLGLKVFKVLPEDELYTLISLCLLLLAFVLYLRPALKTIKTIQALHQQYRSLFYGAITKDCKGNKIDFNSLTLFENDEHKLSYAGNTKEVFVFDSLTFEEGLVIMLSEMKDFVMIVFGVSDNTKKKVKFTKANIKSFTVNVKKLDGKVLEYPLIIDGKFIK